jgi:hypothetical protein
MTLAQLARAFAAALALAAIVGCAKEVYIGVDPGSDAAARDGSDAGTDN